MEETKTDNPKIIKKCRLTLSDATEIMKQIDINPACRSNAMKDIETRLYHWREAMTSQTIPDLESAKDEFEQATDLVHEAPLSMREIQELAVELEYLENVIALLEGWFIRISSREGKLERST